MLGLGSIVGTGVFVSIGIAAGVAGPNVLVAIFVAALVATCNGLSSAQLAAAHPVSGGTYEYGYRWLSPTAGFLAGWLFLCAKSASAATAALGLASYLSTTEISQWMVDPTYFFRIGVALGLLAIMTVVVVIGIKRTTNVNTVIVAVTLLALIAFVLAGAGHAFETAGENLGGVFQFSKGDGTNESQSHGLFAMFNAAALMFVAYTGYGRIATMGEEVAEPRKTIPRAMIATLCVTMVLYLSVGTVAVAIVGANELSSSTVHFGAPLLVVTNVIGLKWLSLLVAVGAVTAMLGVMLNLLLGLSRVVLAMSRRGDLPVRFSTINRHGVPLQATLLVAFIIACLVAIGDIRLSWSFSAMTVLIYYALTNVCAIRVDAGDRIFPVWISWVGLLSCLSLAMFIQWPVLLGGLAVIAVALIFRTVVHPTTQAN